MNQTHGKEGDETLGYINLPHNIKMIVRVTGQQNMSHPCASCKHYLVCLDVSLSTLKMDTAGPCGRAV